LFSWLVVWFVRSLLNKRRKVKRSDQPWLANGLGGRAANGQLESGEAPDHDPDPEPPHNFPRFNTDHTHWCATYNRTRPWQGSSYGDFGCEADVLAPS
jgi:hypothetical protein